MQEYFILCNNKQQIAPKCTSCQYKFCNILGNVSNQIKPKYIDLTPCCHSYCRTCIRSNSKWNKYKIIVSKVGVTKAHVLGVAFSQSTLKHIIPTFPPK